MRTRPRLALVSLLSALTLVALTAPRAHAQRSDDEWLDDCRRHAGSGDQEKYCEVRVEKLPAPTGTLAVDASPNGGAAVTAWSGDGLEVHERIEASAESEDDARDIASRIHLITSGTIHAEGPSSGRHQSWAVSFVVYAPAHTDLRLETENGPIAVRRMVGRMDLGAENGPIVLDEVGGDVHARTTNGPLTVSLTGDRWQGRQLDAETTNGPVVLHLPASFAAHLETGTVNGPMTIDFPITLQGRIGRRISTDLNGGGPTIRAITTNGPVVVDRR